MLRVVICLLVALGSFAAQAQVSDSTAVIEAGGLSITKAEFEFLMSSEEKYRNAIGQPGSRLAVGHDIGRAFALEAEARRRKIDQSSGVQLKIRNFTQQLLAYELLLSLREGYLKNEEALTRHYEARREAFDQPRVQHLLVRAKGSPLALRTGSREMSTDEARTKADALHAKIAGGADFAAFAKAESDDMASRANGGDIGFISRGTMDARFEAAAYSLPVGKLSGVIQTELGFHILRIAERQPLPFQSAKAMIANELAHNDMDAIIQKSYKLNEAYFGK